MIEAIGVSKTFKSTQALRDLSLKVEKGDVYGIIGMSGAGKSTLIRCLARLIPPSSGKILFQGTDIGSLSGKALRHFHMKTGMIFQHFNLLSSRTVRGNVAYPLEIANSPKEKQESRSKNFSISSASIPKSIAIRTRSAEGKNKGSGLHARSQTTRKSFSPTNPLPRSTRKRPKKYSTF